MRRCDEKKKNIIHLMAKKARIKAGSGEKMRKKGAKGAPTKENFRRAKQTAKA